jgi:amino acid adenylation domain-containing protein/non-ribosomal peptide synthase protein (TIGR01720 family)
MSDEVLARSIALIGMAGRFPGAENVAAFWRNLRDGATASVTLSDAELRAAGVPDAMIADPDYVKRRPVLDGIDLFDAGFFGILPREAELMDPQHRLFLECATHALEDAGHARDCRETGVFAGAAISTYLIRNLLANAAVRDGTDMSQLVFANDKDHLATRVGYKLDLRGPCIAVSCACSTSLVAVQMACRALLGYQCDLALAGGAMVMVPQDEGYLYRDGGMASPDGLCRAFDAAARGTVFGSGVGVVVLRRYEDAARDGDHIYAVIRGGAVNNDGAGKVGYTAPSVEGQAAVIAEAQAVAGVDPESISYIEAHGTGTPLGDPIELRALRQAFGDVGGRRGFCAIGSVKTNVGHLDAASGVTGLIKTALALHARELPGSLHFQQPHPDLGLEDSPFRVQTQTAPWPADALPRRAGVSSFGVGGTNAHLVLEEAPENAPGSPPARSTQLLLLSARSEAALARASDNLAEHFTAGPRDGAAAFADAAYSLATGRRTFDHRRAVLATDTGQAAQLLRAPDRVRVFDGALSEGERPVVFMFPGQGVQRIGMGAGLYRSEPLFRGEIDRCAALLQPHLGLDLRELLYPTGLGVDAAALDRTAITQPALFAVEYALARLWMDGYGVRPSALIGHSLGEYVAACIGGVFRLEDALALVAERGRLMQALPEGAMAAVALGAEALAPRLSRDLSIAAINAPDRCVVSGPPAVVEAFLGRMAEDDIEAIRLRTSHAFHSAMMDPILDAFRGVVRGIRLQPPVIPVMSNVDGGQLTDLAATDPEYWVRHLRQPVDFAAGLRTLSDGPRRLYLEVGPGRTLSRLVAAQGGVGATGLPAGEEDAALGTLGRLWSLGAEVDWNAFYRSERRLRVPLPLYPFERRRYWIGPDAAAGPAPAAVANVAPAPPAAASGRLADLRATLHGLVAEASGLAGAEIDPAHNFLDLGLDSLTLIQLNRTIRRRFGIDIPFRELMDRLPSIDALAAHLDTALPAATSEVAPPVVAKASADVDASLVPDLATEAAMGTEAVIPAPARAASTGTAELLTTQQQEYLAGLTARYTGRTAASKKAAQEYRPALADARVSLGFRRLWKEMLYPLMVTRASGAHVWDADGNQYVDLLMGFGVNLFGHWPDFVRTALHATIEREPQLVGPQSPLAGPVAQRLCAITGNERATFCNTGSEAVMTAIRLARTATGRDRIVLFRDSYHGNFDSVMVRPRGEAGAVPAAIGIPQHAADDIVILDYCADATLDFLDRNGSSIAAVLIEPVQCRRPELDPRSFLRDLRGVADRTGMLLIFDEVVTGFRLHPGGAQALFGVRADLATYGKVLGGGMPIGVVAGRADVMDAIDGGMWGYGDESFPRSHQTAFAGTFCKHPFAVAAAGAVLDHVSNQGSRLQQDLNARTAGLVLALNDCFANQHAPISIQSCASIFKFTPEPGFRHIDLFFYELRSRGISVWEERPYFLSTAHSEADIALVAQATEESLSALRRGGMLPQPSRRKLTNSAPVHQVPLPLVPETASYREPSRFTPAGTNPSETRIPLTGPQREIWVASELGPDASAAYTLTAAMRLTGPLDVVALNEALNRVIARHEALRLVLEPDGSGQHFVPLLRLDLMPEDLSALPAEERTARLDARLEREAQTVFDLTHGPLLRAGLLRLEQREHVLVVSAHHIACDGISMDIVLQEVLSIYLGGRDVSLEKPMGFAEYVAWEGSRRAAANAACDFWADRLREAVPVLELPLEQARPKLPGITAGRETLTLDGAGLPALRAMGSRRGATPLITLLTCFAVLLHRLSGQDRLIIGLPVTGRNVLDGRPLVGHCVNLVPLPVAVDRDQSFADVLAHVRDSVLAAQEHWDVTPGQLASTLRVQRDPGRPLLAAVTFNLETAPSELHRGALSLAPVPVPKRYVQFELEVNAVDTGRAITLTCDYNAALFDGPTVRRWLGHLREIANGAAAQPDMAVGRLPLLSPAEWQALLRPADLPLAAPDGTLHHWFERRAAELPDAIAVVVPEEDRGPDAVASARLTYGALNARANQLALHLRGLGVGPEQIVGLYLDRTPEVIVGLLGILKAGGAYLPLDPTFPPERIAFMLRDAGASVVVTEDALAPLLPSDGLAVVSLDSDRAALASLPEHDLPGGAGEGNAAYVIYTSGSTGRPKGVLVTHRNVTRLLTAAQDSFRFGRHDVWTCVHSYAFDFSVWETWGALLHGGRLVVVPYWVARAPEALLALLEREQVTVLNQTPSAFRQLTATGAVAPPDLRLIIFGGEALNFQELGPWFTRTGDARPLLVNMYGITETTVHVTRRALSQPDAHLTASLIGEALPDLGMTILDGNLQPVPLGVAGEIHVGGAGLARGYLGRPALTAEKFVPDPHGLPGGRLYRSGDLARRTSNGEVAYIGRLDHQVQLRGYRIETGEIEAALRAEGAREAVVVLRAGEDGHQRLVAYLAADEPPIGALREKLARRLPDYMLPAQFVALPSLPKTSSGKIDRAALPAPAAASTPEETEAPRSAVEQLLAEIWAEALGVAAVGINDNFFELGGDSIINIQIVARARRAGLRFSPRDLFVHPSVAALAAVAQPVETEPRVHQEPAGPIPLLPMQCRFLQGDPVDPSHFNQSVLLEVAADLEVEYLRQALHAVVGHHAAFRLRFTRDADGQWTQAAGADSGVGFAVIDAPDVAAANASIRAAQAALDIERGPLVQTRLLRTGVSGQRPDRLLIVIHHLVTDGVTWRLLLSDLDTAYRQARRNEPIVLPSNGTSLAVWAHRLRDRAASSAVMSGLDHWLVPGRVPLPVDFDGGRDTVAFEQHVSVGLPASRTRTLLAGRRKAGASAEDLLVAGLAIVLGRWCGASDVLVDMEAHGRDDDAADTDLTRTAGWLTALYPVLLHAPEQAAPETVLQDVVTRLRSVPGRGLDYGLLRYLSPDPAVVAQLARAPRAEVLWNYLGQLRRDDSGPFGVVTRSGGSERSPRTVRSHVLEINALIDGDALQVEFTYSSARHRQDTIEKLAAGYIAILEDLIGDAAVAENTAAGYVPSDFPDADLTEDDLAALVAELAGEEADS